jgi:hypothetical protein
MPSPCPAGRTRSTIDAQAGAWVRLQSAVPGAGLIDVVWPRPKPRLSTTATAPPPLGPRGDVCAAITVPTGFPTRSASKDLGTEPAQHGPRYRNRPGIAPVTRAMRLAQGPEASAIRTSRSSERDLEDAADAGVSLMNAQARQPARIDPSARPAERDGNRSNAPRHQPAGQAPLSAGSRIATHSTCDVIGKMSEVGILGVTAGQAAFSTPPKGPLNARSVKRASRPRYALASVPETHPVQYRTGDSRPSQP